jgi:hypothetical protein
MTYICNTNSKFENIPKNKRNPFIYIERGATILINLLDLANNRTIKLQFPEKRRK